MNPLDIIMKVIKVGFSLINGLLAVFALFLLYKMLVKLSNDQAGIMHAVMPLYLFLVFSLNAISNWKQFPIVVSVIQIIATMIPVPIILIFISVAVPFALSASTKSVPEADQATADGIIEFSYYITYLFIALSLNVAAQAFYDRKMRKDQA